MLTYSHQFHYIFILPIYKNKQKYLNNKLKNLIPASLQLILLNQGSLTKILNYINAKQVILKKFQKNNHTLKNNRYLRYIWIEDCLYTKLIFAKSLWQFKYDKSHRGKEKLKNHIPIGISIVQYEIDIYKEVQEIYYGYCIKLNHSLNYDQPMWGRKYTLYYDNRLLATVQEFFSPYIINFFTN
uniref:Ycf21 n=1 Tax=Caloglossa intermedia TaxID=100879 RepID=A0A1Z1M5W6_9FLOR|nr:hypothetical protein [Caloglossa intermedia]ARW61396.1 hypothetical protein [Caloglossa intermedia]